MISSGVEKKSPTIVQRLARRLPLSSRPLPPLEPIKQAVSRIQDRWPDIVPIPRDVDREKMAQDMRRRIRDWNWDEITTQQVIAAAGAVFDSERRDRSDLKDVRAFYFKEIATGRPGPFLDGLAGVYINSFTENADHSHALAQKLRERSSELGARRQRLLAALPALFTTDRVSQQLEDIMSSVPDARAELKSIGLTYNCGLARAAQEKFVKNLAPQLKTQDARRKLFNWFAPANGPVIGDGAEEAVAALLRVWRDETPPDDLRQDLSEKIITAWQDPRIQGGGIWPLIDGKLKEILFRWLSHQDMKYFCEMVTATQDSHMWPPRRDFWLALDSEKKIDEAWVAFSPAAYDYVKQNLLKKDAQTRFAKQTKRNDLSLLIMKIDNKIIVEGCHSYKTHIFHDDDPDAPKLYQGEYDAEEIRTKSLKSKAHISISNWKSWVERYV